MRFPNHVTVSTDFIGFWDAAPIIPTTHPYCGPTPPFTLPIVPFIETTTTMWWPPGALLGKNKFASDVYHNNDMIAQEGHDVGPLVPHVYSSPCDNVHLIIETIKSSRKGNFAAGEVKANGKPIGCFTMIDLAIIPTPMTPCSVVPMPLCGTGGTACLTNEVIVGMHFIDMLAGWFELVVSSLFSLLKLGLGDDMPSWAPNPSALIGGLIRMAGQEVAGYHGDAKASLTLSAGFATRSFNLERSGTSGRWTASTAGRYGPNLSGDGAAGNFVGNGLARDMANLHDTESISWGGDGDEGVVATVQGGVGVLGQSGDLGVSNRRPGDDRAGFFGSGSSTWGRGSTPIGSGLDGVPEL